MKMQLLIAAIACCALLGAGCDAEPYKNDPVTICTQEKCWKHVTNYHILQGCDEFTPDLQKDFSKTIVICGDFTSVSE